MHSRNAPVITCQAATQLIAHAIAHATDQGWTVAAVVVDPSGAMIAATRMDGVSPTILETATDKAFTAALGKSTSAFFDRMSSSPDLTLGLQTRPRLCTWEGGVTIVEGTEVIGAIGVSGAEGHQDTACARTALTHLGLTPR